MTGVTAGGVERKVGVERLTKGVFAVVAAVVMSACAFVPADVAGSASSAEGSDPGRSDRLAQPSALDDPDHPDLPAPLVDTSRIISGGPPPDGIPPIFQPSFEPVAEVDWLHEAEPVVLLQHNDEVRIYPVQIMVWHEIVNDSLGGEPVAVTYCPLCNTAIAFPALVDGRQLDFGTSGMLYKSALVMYDRQTESLWSQVERRAIAGALAGSQLEALPVAMLSWSDAASQRPDALVLARPAATDRPYGTNPYTGYDTSDWTLLDEEPDGRLPAKDRVVHLLGWGIAVRSSELADRRVGAVRAGGRDAVLFAAPGLASALDDRAIAEGRPIPATGVFSSVVDGRRLRFEPARSGHGEVAVDRQTRSRWTILGTAVSGPLEGMQLQRIASVDTFWFAAKAFVPDLRVVPLEGEAPRSGPAGMGRGS